MAGRRPAGELDIAQSENRFERAFLRIMRGTSGQTLLGLVVLVYGGGGLAIPLALGSSVAILVFWNIICTVIAGLIVFLWIFVRVERMYQRNLVEWTTDLRLLNAEEFEWLVGEVLRREGWMVRETGRQYGPDGNVDLELTGKGKRMIAQCKRWVSWQVRVDDIRQFGGTLLREKLPGEAGIFITLSNFTEQARAEAGKIGMTIVDGPDLWRRIEKVRRSEQCTVCKMPMVLDRSDYGWWLRCTVDGCRGKRHLGSVPGLAVDLLLERPQT